MPWPLFAFWAVWEYICIPVGLDEGRTQPDLNESLLKFDGGNQEVMVIVYTTHSLAAVRKVRLPVEQPTQGKSLVVISVARACSPSVQWR